MPVDPGTATVIAAYQRTSEQLRDRVVAYVRRTWLALDNYRDADIDRFAAAVAPAVEGGQVQIAALTDAYLARVEAAVLGESTQPVGIPTSVSSTAALRGVPADVLWQRPGLSVWDALGQGADLTQAVTAGMHRATDLAETNLQLAATHSAREVFAAKRNVAGYRRVPRGGASCALCLLAATQRYHKNELMPIHPGCRCGVHAIYGGRDPGQVLDPDQRDAIHKTIADFTGQPPDFGARAPDYREFIVTHDHGEIGPVLGKRGNHFSGPNDLGGTKHPRPPRSPSPPPKWVNQPSAAKAQQAFIERWGMDPNLKRSYYPNEPGRRFVSFAGMHPDAANQVAGTLDHLFREYPETATWVSAVGTSPEVTRFANAAGRRLPPMHPRGFADYSSTARTMRITTRTTSSTYEDLAEEIRDDFDGGWFAAPDLSGVVAHEFGHALDANARAAVTGATRPIDFEAAIRHHHRGADGQPVDVASALSEYGATDLKEEVAEAFAEVTTAIPPRPYAKRIIQTVKKNLLDAGGAL